MTAQEVYDRLRGEINDLARLIDFVAEDCGRLAFWGQGPTASDREACLLVEKQAKSLGPMLRDWESKLAGVAVSMAQAEADRG